MFLGLNTGSNMQKSPPDKLKWKCLQTKNMNSPKPPSSIILKPPKNPPTPPPKRIHNDKHWSNLSGTIRCLPHIVKTLHRRPSDPACSGQISLQSPPCTARRPRRSSSSVPTQRRSTPSAPSSTSCGPPTSPGRRRSHPSGRPIGGTPMGGFAIGFEQYYVPFVFLIHTFIKIDICFRDCFYVITIIVFVSRSRSSNNLILLNTMGIMLSSIF